MERPLTRAADRHLRRGLQSAAREALVKKKGVWQHEARIRHKLERWQCGHFPRIRAQRALAVVKRLRVLLLPRVCSAILRTCINGWCSTHKFQWHGPCLLGCGRGEDSIEHYACCRRTAELGANLLAIPLVPLQQTADKLRSFLLLEAGASLSNGLLTRKALLTAAICRLHCRLRRGSPVMEWSTLRTACRQALQELTGGSGRAATVLDIAFMK
jgi:hypothetical protein